MSELIPVLENNVLLLMIDSKLGFVDLNSPIFCLSCKMSPQGKEQNRSLEFKVRSY